MDSPLDACSPLANRPRVAQTQKPTHRKPGWDCETASTGGDTGTRRLGALVRG
jgi:hypothetical protein